MEKKKRERKIIAVRPSIGNEWLFAALEKRRKQEGRPSLNNTAEHILVNSLKTKRK